VGLCRNLVRILQSVVIILFSDAKLLCLLLSFNLCVVIRQFLQVCCLEK